MATFNFTPARGAQLSIKPRVRSSQFGDGYEQRVADGINTQLRRWSLQFTRETSDIDSIEAFFVARNGTESFTWVPPEGASGIWLCREWVRTVAESNVQMVSAVFEEVFGD